MTTQRAQTMTRPTNRLEHDDDTNRWWDRALCHGRDPSIWEDKARIREARDICKDCPVKAMCVKDALDADDFWHTRGGMTGDKLRQLARTTNHRPGAPFPTTRQERLERITDMLAAGTSRRDIIHISGLAPGTVDDYINAIRASRGEVKHRGPAVCGTYQGYRRHNRDGSPSCDPCRRANAAYSAKMRAFREARDAS